MSDGAWQSKEKLPRLLTTGKQGKYSISYKWVISCDPVSAEESTWKGAFAFSNRSLIRPKKALGRLSPSTRLMVSNNSGQDCWRRRSPGDCLIGTLSTSFLYRDSCDSNCGRRAHTGEGFSKSNKIGRYSGRRGNISANGEDAPNEEAIKRCCLLSIASQHAEKP